MSCIRILLIVDTTLRRIERQGLTWCSFVFAGIRIFFLTTDSDLMMLTFSEPKDLLVTRRI